MRTEPRRPGPPESTDARDAGSVVYGARWAGIADDDDDEPLAVPPDRASLIDQPGTSLAETLIDRLVEFGWGLFHDITRRR